MNIILILFGICILTISVCIYRLYRYINKVCEYLDIIAKNMPDLLLTYLERNEDENNEKNH